MEKVRAAMIGVGNISGIYLKNIHERFTDIELVGVCDLVREKAENAKEKYPHLKIYDSMYDAFRDDTIDVILNITRPNDHYEVSMEALKHGKHVYSEKPLASTLDKGIELVKEAEKRNLYLGGAPDTFMGAGIQTCRKLIDEGTIGRVIGANAHMIGHGPESWHPDPEFFYKHGGGPIMDMGPYYITALVNLMGRVEEVCGMAKASFETRTITAKEHYGEEIEVEVPTYVDGTLRFESGAVAHMFATFDVYYPHAAMIEIYGSEGTLYVPDPNWFGGEIRLFDSNKEMKSIDMEFEFTDNSRGLGLWDMCACIREGASPRAGCQQTLHVLEVLRSFEKSAKSGGYVKIESPYERQKPMNKNAETEGRIL
ncbi:MAG: Gfo/Idh/MocA family oxidoreductase [Clostridia bacterium]|nr:Gfo/Idh/MocA family oxidoreductase [Clostridia bacterium]